MPGFTRAKKRKHPKKEMKLPTGQLKLQPANTEMKNPVDEKVQAFCDELMQSEWKSWMTRPKQADMFGFFAVMRYYNQEKTWVVLYVGKGVVRHELDQIFSGRSGDAIGHYMSCFPKNVKGSKNLVWLKWLEDPYYPYESLHLKEVTSVVAARYNCSEVPAFNADHADLLPRDELPEDFSIIPDWNKKSKSKSKRKAN